MPDRGNVLASRPFHSRYRNLVEDIFDRIEHVAAVATRSDKDPAASLATVRLAAVRLRIRTDGSPAEADRPRRAWD